MNANALLLLVALLAASSPALAKGLRDPTRPLVPGDASRSDRAATSARPGTAAPKPAVLLPQLQMVLISPTRRTVVIDGVLLSEGDDFRGLRLVEIRPDGVILQAAGGLRLLPLLPPDDGPAAPPVPAK